MTSKYVSTDRGVVKIAEIIIGFAVCAILCANWYGGSSCFGEGRLGFSSGLNFVVVVINIVLFVLNVCSLEVLPNNLERLFNLVASILFFIAGILLVWYIVEWGAWTAWLIIATICVFVLSLLHMWDFRAHYGIHGDHLPI
ncbi:Protein M60.4 b [Aphelenchoides avenae]|nr:Protein M60.4 b [Aphelenchus avenae]